MSEEKKYTKISGWLLLVIFGYVYSIIKNIDLLNSIYELYSNSTMSNLSDSTSEYYNKKLFFVINYELFFAVIVIAAVIIGLTLMLKKKKVFPKYAIFLIIFSQLMAMIDIILCVTANLKIPTDTIPAFVGGVFGGIIWVAYFLKSVRVKQTFIN